MNSVLSFDSGKFDEEQTRAAASNLVDAYRNADPFRHIVIDRLVDDSILHRVAQDFPSQPSKSFNRAQELRKKQYHPSVCGAATRNFFHELNSQAFLTFLTELTGINGLVSDPYFVGGGLHETEAGGRLAVHADFIRHPKMMLQRRLNLLIYLNEDWPESYGGHLELWDRDMEECKVRVLPEFARAVIFNTDLDSYHGQPEPLTCPPERSRKSIATYYYTAPEGTEHLLAGQATKFRPRPGTKDKPDILMMGLNAARDWTPPIIQRAAAKLRKR